MRTDVEGTPVPAPPLARAWRRTMVLTLVGALAGIVVLQAQADGPGDPRFAVMLALAAIAAVAWLLIAPSLGFVVQPGREREPGRLRLQTEVLQRVHSLLLGAAAAGSLVLYSAERNGIAAASALSGSEALTLVVAAGLALPAAVVAWSVPDPPAPAALGPVAFVRDALRRLRASRRGVVQLGLWIGAVASTLAGAVVGALSGPGTALAAGLVVVGLLLGVCALAAFLVGGRLRRRRG